MNPALQQGWERQLRPGLRPDLLSLFTRSEKNEADVLACVREHGICVLPGYHSGGDIERLRTACVERVDIPEDTNFADGSYKRHACYAGTAAQPNERVYHIDCFSELGESIRHDRFLKGIVSAYYGELHSVHLSLYERHRFDDVPARSFHVDTFETSTFKVALYLCDVGLKDGPFCYIPGTHTNTALREKKLNYWGPAVAPGDPAGQPHPTNFTADELSSLLDEATPIVGARGTAVLFDTWGVHCGLTPMSGGERHIVFNYYRKGADLPRSDFGFDVQADHRRYAVDFRKHMEEK